jgi:hypothetical protein
MSTVSNTSFSNHPYLPDVKADDIRSWSAAVPIKQANAVQEEYEFEPAVQAYLQAKMALFGSALMPTDRQVR